MELNTFLQLAAREVMVAEPVTLSPEDTLAKAAYVFLHQQVSGAPVIDEEGRCVGVLSVTDLVGAEEKAQHDQARAAEAFFGQRDLILPLKVYDETLSQVRDRLVPIAERPVRDFMVTDLVAVDAETRLVSVLRDFLDAHVHRVLVVDADRRLQGIISSIDVIAAMLRHAEVAVGTVGTTGAA